MSGFLLGLILAVIGFLRIVVWSVVYHRMYPMRNNYTPILGTRANRRVRFLGIVLWGTLSGAMLPFVLKRLGLDPATSSAPLSLPGRRYGTADLFQRGPDHFAGRSVIECSEPAYLMAFTLPSLSRR